MVPTYEGTGGDTKINIIGLEFDNVTYPSSDIVGHRFLLSKRDQSNSTVLDTGVAISPGSTGIVGQNVTYQVGGLFSFGASPSDPINIAAVVTPKVLFERSTLNPSHIEIVRELQVSDSYTEGFGFSADGGGTFDFDTRVRSM